jgi:hypothetical protein
MEAYELTKGEGRTKINLLAYHMGNDFIISIFNKNAHIGAVALSQKDPISGLVSTSIITALGHKDDVVAQRTAYLISKRTSNATCAIVGIHIDNATEEEIKMLMDNSESLVLKFLIEALPYGI